MKKKLLFYILFFFCAVPVSEMLSKTEAFAQAVDTAWVRRYNGPGNSEDRARAIAVDNHGNVYVTGDDWGGSQTYEDCATIKYDPDGNQAWVRRYNGSANDFDGGLAIAIDDSGNIYVTGLSTNLVTGEDYLTIKYYPNGNTAWLKVYDGEGYDNIATDIAVDNYGNVYVTGIIIKPETSSKIATVKYYPNGDTAWVRKYQGPREIAGFISSWGSALAIDDSGNVYVTGKSYNIQTDDDYITMKYYPNGDTAWVRRYNGPADSVDAPVDISIDDSGNVYVTGNSLGNSTGTDYSTIKYYPNGDTAWIRRYNGPGNLDDCVYALAIDGLGNVYVTGYTWDYLPTRDYTTIKYYPNGDTAWVRKYYESGNEEGWAHDIRLDGSGNIYVTGGSYSVGTSLDYATIKYYPNGDTAWVRRYNGPGNLPDEAWAIAEDDYGNVYVTGVVNTTGVDPDTNPDFTTIKYVQFQTRQDTLLCFAYSPVDLIVIDPIGDSIGVSFNTIPNATYDTTTDKNQDGDLDDIVTIPNPLVGDYMVRVVAEPGADTGHYTLGVKLDRNEDNVMIASAPVPPPDQVDSYIYPVIEYLRGDANSDKKTTVSDVVFLINYLFKGGPAPNPVYLGEVNCDGKTTVSDVVYLINYIFKGGSAPCS